jgi:hypothetical protein
VTILEVSFRRKSVLYDKFLMEDRPICGSLGIDFASFSRVVLSILPVTFWAAGYTTRFFRNHVAWHRSRGFMRSDWREVDAPGTTYAINLAPTLIGHCHDGSFLDAGGIECSLNFAQLNPVASTFTILSRVRCTDSHHLASASQCRQCGTSRRRKMVD